MAIETQYQFMEFNVKILRLLCLWLEDNDTDEFMWSNWKKYYLYIILLPSFIPLLLEAFFVFMEPDAGILKITSVLLAEVCVAGGLYMGLCFWSNRKRIKGVVNSIRDFQRFSDLDIRRIDEDTTKYSKGFFYYTVIGALVYAVAPMLNLKTCEEKKPQYMRDWGIPCGLIVSFRLPFKYEKSPLFEIYVVHQLATTTTISLIIVVVTMLICGLLRHAVLQLEKLRLDMLDISNRPHDDLDMVIKACVQYHQSIIKFIDEVNEAFGSQLLLHVTLTSLVISILGFVILMEEDKFESTRYAFHLAGWLLILFLICLYGQYLIDESTGLADAAYSTPWYNSPVSVQKDIKMIIQRSQKPLTLKAFNIGILSKVTFLRILSSAYSYFTLLIKMKK